ncbi:MAG: phosphoribosylamine--glycine ligase [Candidatus Saganbacteria bacterium]|nr:phosphoribosylamine--glycine ligase [Candidatus Saganbacteria bacterium]
MKILVVGSGGREHALVWKISQSPKVTKIYAAPGNAGMAALAELVDISAEDVEELKKFVLKNKIDLTVVGPEAPLSLGIVDEFEKAGLRVFGPSEKAAFLEGSKVFAKQLMIKYSIPTAQAKVFDDYNDAIEHLEEMEVKHGLIQKMVVKADGLAAGKGVVVCENIDDAEDAVDQMLRKEVFGEAGSQVLIEECLEGEEASILAFVDGKTIVPMVASQDHKRIFDGDKGPNTGGMGAYSPAPVVEEYGMAKIQKEILDPVLNALNKEDIKYKGVLYVGLMFTKDGPKVLEFNCRFGDPETQVVLPRLETDLIDIMEAIIDECLSQVKLEWSSKPAVCVVLASEGYPGSYRKGIPIHGINLAEALDGITVFHAGTKLAKEDVVTTGGRVLGVTALGDTINTAITKAYKAVKLISFDGMQYRNDIGQKALRRLK